MILGNRVYVSLAYYGYGIISCFRHLIVIIYLFCISMHCCTAPLRNTLCTIWYQRLLSTCKLNLMSVHCTRWWFVTRRRCAPGRFWWRYIIAARN